jgi:branched-subunit amino acid aminotransferase/4-amino-4-deoxychorismate lyase
MQDWVDGRPAQQLGVKDRGLAYGDGLFETIAVRAGRPTLFDAHLQRLQTSCERLAIKVDQALLRVELQAYAAELGEATASVAMPLIRRQKPAASCRAGLLPLIHQAMRRKALASFPARRVWPNNRCWPGSSI